MTGETPREVSTGEAKAFRRLIGCAVTQVALYVSIAGLSYTFVYGQLLRERPIILVLLLFTGCFAGYLLSLRFGLRCRPGPRLGLAIIVPALVFRAILLCSEPIQEIDYYRYLWDGAAAANGVSPYRYSPADVLAAPSDANLPGDLLRLVELRDESPVMGEILRRIHFAELSTMYPPVSQTAFATAFWLTPSSASVQDRTRILRVLIVTFDIATIVLVWALLRLVSLHPAWTLTYAWCPLVIKEFANSGHFDSIAVCLTTTAVYLFVKGFVRQTSRRASITFSGVGVVLGLAIGAKLYAIVLLPLIGAAAAARFGWRPAVYAYVTAFATAGLCLAPMFLSEPKRNTFPPGSDEQIPALSSERSSDAVPSAPLSGASAFFSRWEMNDFLFLIVVENLRPVGELHEQPRAWFAALPDPWRRFWNDRVAQSFQLDGTVATFLLARSITSGLFAITAVWLAWRAYRADTADQFLESAFLTLAWFWLLSPTQNPWYWIWALPFLPFARNRAWLFVSGLVLVYYLRFWLEYHFSGTPVPGTNYSGVQFFDFVVTWLEYGPWMSVLIGMAVRRRSIGHRDYVRI